MDRDAERADRQDEALQGDTGMIGSESEEPGPGRDTSLTDPDPVAASTDQPEGTVAMSEGDPMRTRLGSHVEDAEAIGDAPAAFDRDPGLAPEPVVDQGDLGGERDPGLAAEPAVDQGSYGQDPGAAGGAAAAGGRVEDAGPSDRSVFADEPPAPESSAFATEDAGNADRATVAEDPARAAGYEGEPGGQDSVYDQEADRARQRPSDG